MSSYQTDSMVPNGETESGFYSASAKGCKEEVAHAIPMVMKAVENIAFVKSDHPFVICDYGTSDGGTSMPLIRRIIKYIKLKYGESQPVHIVYEDQPVNDFKTLFLLTQGSDSYLNNFEEVYITASGTNFYEQCLPSGSVHLSLSFTAMQRLSKIPCNLSHTIYAEMSAIGEEKQEFTKQAAQDWETLLLHRARELVHGGEMIIVQLCVDGNGSCVGNNKGNISLLLTISDLWKSMVTVEEFRNTNVNIHIRSEAEVKAPFEDHKSSVYKAGLRLKETKIMLVNCPHYQEWESSAKTQDDARAYAKKLATMVYPWLSSTLFNGLSEDKTRQQKVEIVDEFFQKFEKIAAENPKDHICDMMEVYQHIQKL